MEISKEMIERFDLSERNIKDIQKKYDDIKNNNKEKTLKFVIEGDPVHAHRPRKGKFGFYVPGAKENKQNLRPIVAEQLPDGYEPFETGCKIKVVAYRQTLSTFSRTDTVLAELGIIRPITTPDVDNRVKPYMDIMNGLVYKDDGQVTEAHIYEYYSQDPRVEIFIKYESMILSAKLKK